MLLVHYVANTLPPADLGHGDLLWEGGAGVRLGHHVLRRGRVLGAARGWVLLSVLITASPHCTLHCLSAGDCARGDARPVRHHHGHQGGGPALRRRGGGQGLVSGEAADVQCTDIKVHVKVVKDKY